MKIVFISDTHGFHHDLTQDLAFFIDVDMICHSGDVSNRGKYFEIKNFLEWFSKLNQFKYKIFIAGNHDFGFETNPNEIQELLKDYPNIIYLQDSGIEIEGIYFWGSPQTPRFFDWAFNVDRGAPIKKYWDQIPEHTNVLITHGPPYGHGDLVENTRYNPERNVGCKDLLKKIEELKPEIHVFGHIHSGNGITKNENTTFINASSVNEAYQYEYMPVSIVITKNDPNAFNLFQQ